MATYKFKSTDLGINDVTFSNYTIIPDERSIHIDNIDLILNIDVIFKSNDGVDFRVKLTNIPQNGGSWTAMDLLLGIMTKLEEYRVD